MLIMLLGTNYAQNYAGIIGKALLLDNQPEILCFSEQLSREEEAQAMGVGLKYSDNNRLWLTVYTRSFVSYPILTTQCLQGPLP